MSKKIYGIPVTTPFNPEKLAPKVPTIELITGKELDGRNNVTIKVTETDGEFIKEQTAKIIDGQNGYKGDSGADGEVIFGKSAGSMIEVNDSSDRPLQGLTIYGKTTQNGTPTQENPVELVSVGDSGSITVGLRGKNLWGRKEITFTKNKDTQLSLPLPPGTYTVSAEVTTSDTDSGRSLFGFYLSESKEWTYVEFRRKGNRESFTKIITEPVTILRMNAGNNLASSEGDTATWKNVQVELGKNATEFELPKELQSLTVSTPNGLPGIRSAIRYNYTDENGQTWISDLIDFARGKYVRNIGRISSYAGEEIPGEFMSTTGVLSEGATVLYALDTPIETNLTDEVLAQYAALIAHNLNTVVYNDAMAHMEMEYVADTKTYTDSVIPDTIVKPVEKAWEQRLLERIDLAMIPMVARAKLPKAPSGYSYPGQTLTGINYSAVFLEEDGSNLVGTQVPLSAYYSALENPASKMYTEDNYQYDNRKSSYYGINCSGFVSYVCGFGEWIWTTKMATLFADKVLSVVDENDLFQVRRGDILLNTVVSSGHGDHVKVVKDAVHCRTTGKLLGFNIAHSVSPFVKTEFLNLEAFLAQFYAEQPYRLIRLEDSDYGLTVDPVEYSKAVYPDKGDGGKYSVGESIWLYLPDCMGASVLVSVDDGERTSIELASMNSQVVNGVTVYEYVPNIAGTYSIRTNTAINDPCKVYVV